MTAVLADQVGGEGTAGRRQPHADDLPTEDHVVVGEDDARRGEHDAGPRRGGAAAEGCVDVDDGGLDTDVFPEPPSPRVAITAVAAALAANTKMTMATPNATRCDVRLGGGGGSYV